MMEEPASLESVSQNGVLVYSGGPAQIQLAWHNREGIRQAAIGEPGIYMELDLSPDERRLALVRYNTAKDTDEVWILETSTGILSPLNAHSSSEPHWSPNSRELVFSSSERGINNVYRESRGRKRQDISLPGR
jgi:Tol biopolymer transport system component